MQREENVNKGRIVGIRTSKMMVVYLEDGQFMGFVEAEGAKVIKRSSIDKNYRVEDFGFMFNIVNKGVSIENV